MKKYTWEAVSNDGNFEDNGGWFDTHKEAYEDMRCHALEKIKWNTEWEDFSDMDEKDWIGYDVKFHRNYIIHESYSGIYTYSIKSSERVYLHDREWTVIGAFTPNEDHDWEVSSFEGIGKMWMNNYDGYVVLIEPSGRILKSYI
jgi:hypothetical protein